jgi:hypothetical protein
MKVTNSVMALTLFLAGCGSCERSSDAPGGGGAGKPAQEAGPATSRPLASPPVEGAVQTPPGTGHEENAANAEDGDCIVIGDASPDYGAPPLEVELSAEAECTTGEPTYRWDFGDGSPASTEPTVTHTYANVGEYVAVITVTGPDGSTSTDELDITVEEEAADLE